jgi:hypothetical protein
MKEMPPLPEPEISEKILGVAEVVEAIFGCEWSLRILGLIQRRISRPRAIGREVEGLTPKVENYYFRRMIELGMGSVTEVMTHCSNE